MKKAFIQLHLSIVLAGFTGVFGKLITLNEGLLTWYRLLLSGTLSLAWLALSRRIGRIFPADALRLGGAGFLLAMHWVFFYGSIKYSNISVGVVAFSLTGFFTAVLEPLINRSPVQTRNLLLSSITLLGIALIFHFDTRYRVGIALGIISSLLASAFTIVNKRLTVRFDAATITLYEMAGGFAGLSCLLPLYLRITGTGFVLPSSDDLAYLLILSVFCTILMYLLINQALSRISAFTVNLSFNLEPIYSILLAMVLFGENRELNPAFYGGLALIVLSVVLTSLKRQ